MILLINDDGIYAPTLRSLYAALRERLQLPVLVVAPVAQQSGQAHAITLDRGLTISPHSEEDFFGFAIDGTPTDCIKVALQVICPVRPKLVISGINDGPNVGRSIFYSGTVAAAMEAAVEGYSAIAVSRNRSDRPFKEAAAYTAELASACLGRRELRGRVINVNLPAGPRAEWQEAVEAAHGLSGFAETYRPKRVGKRTTWHLTGTWRDVDEEGNRDAGLLSRGFPTLTLLEPNCNARSPLPGRLLDKIRANT